MAGLIIAAGVAAAGAIAGGVIASQGAQSAAKTQANAALTASQDAGSIQQNEFDVQQANLAPYLAAGKIALPALEAGTQPGGQFNRNFTLQDFQQDPGYAFDLQQGNQAVQRSAAALGDFNSGGTLKAIENYTQGAASTEFNNAYNRFNTSNEANFGNLAALAGIGTNSNNTFANVGTNAANNIANTTASGIATAGNAMAAGTVGSANAVTGGINAAAGTISQYGMVNRIFPGAGNNSSFTNDPGVSSSNLSNFSNPAVTGMNAPSGFATGAGIWQ